MALLSDEDLGLGAPTPRGKGYLPAVVSDADVGLESSSPAAAGFTPSSSAKGAVEDIIRSAAPSLAEGAIGLAGLPGDVGGGQSGGYIGKLVRGGLRMAGLNVPSEENAAAAQAKALGGPDISAPTGQTIQAAVEKGTGPFYQAETVPGQYTSAILRNAPSALFPGGVGAKVAQTVVPAVAGETVGQAGGGPLAQAAASLAGGMGVTRTQRALAQRAAKQAPADMVGDLQDAATPTYKELTAIGNKTILPEKAGKQMAYAIGMDLHPQALRPANAERTYGQLKQLSKAKDLNDVAIARDKLRDIANGISENKLVSVPRQDAKAARRSVTLLDQRMDELHSGWVAQMKEADSNWAASRRIQTVADYAEADKNFNSFNNNATRVKGYTKDELAAIKQAATGGKVGTALNTVGSALNPLHGGLTPAIQFGMHAAATVPTGGANWLAYLAGAPVGMAADAGARALKNRAYNKAINKLGQRSPLGEQITSPVQPLSVFAGGQYALPGILADPKQRQLLLGD